MSVTAGTRQGDPDPNHQVAPEHTVQQVQGRPLMRVHLPAVTTPDVLNHSRVAIPADAPVLGVVVGSESRAYLLEALAMVQEHVINDVVGGEPVTVTYCNLSGCSRVLTTNNTHTSSEQPADPLAVSVAGLFDVGTLEATMAVELDSKVYAQDSPELPLRNYPHLRTTWGEWLTAHPDTVVFIGQMRRFRRQP
ncbi:MAG: DUF3179 domain-containing protein [Planctomycetales bacterium]|nr:DUF3179 domain-containing protein [Planctomycetales bacterium]